MQVCDQATGPVKICWDVSRVRLIPSPSTSQCNLRLKGTKCRDHSHACFQYHEPAHRPRRQGVSSSGSTAMQPRSVDPILTAVSSAEGTQIMQDRLLAPASLPPVSGASQDAWLRLYLRPRPLPSPLRLKSSGASWHAGAAQHGAGPGLQARGGAMLCRILVHRISMACPNSLLRPDLALRQERRVLTSASFSKRVIGDVPGDFKLRFISRHS